MSESAVVLDRLTPEAVALARTRGRFQRLWALMALNTLASRRNRHLLKVLPFFVLAGVVTRDATALFGFMLGAGVVGSLLGLLTGRPEMERLYAALPVGRADIVNAHWMAGVLCLAGVAIIDALAVMAFPGAHAGKAAVVFLAVQTAMVALGIPILMRFGQMAGFFIWHVAVTAIGAVLFLLLSFEPIREAVLGAMVGRLLGAVLLLGVLLGLWALSHRIYARQDH